MTRTGLFLVAITSAMLVRCDPQKLESDAAAAVSAFQQDKSIVESLVADTKRGYAPDTTEYQSAETSYYRARRANDQYLAQLGLAATTGDRSVAPDTSGDAARATMTQFVRDATGNLSTDRSLATAISFVAFPTIQKILSTIPAKKRPDAARAFINKMRWRSWDSISSIENDKNVTPAAKKARSKKVNAITEE
jgi:hypothetical protein